MKLFQIITILFVLIIAGCGSKGDTKNMQQQKDKNIQQALTVEAVVAREEISGGILFSTGTILSNEEVQLQSEVPGKIIKILFEEGSNVSEGQLLVKLNDKEIQAELQKSVFEKKLLEEKEFRQRKLLEIQAISQEEYDASLNALNVIKANISMLQAQIEKTEIRAPFAGTIGLKNVNVGATISPATIIVSLQSVSPVKIDFSVPEKYSNQIRKGTKIIFTVEGSDKTYSGSVYATEPKIDPGSRTLRIRELSSNKDKSILPGSFANVQLELGENNKVIMIPTQALIPDISGAKVFVSEDGKAVSKQVETGLRTESHIQILSGLAEGDTVLISGILQLKPGVPVKVNMINGSSTIKTPANS